MTEDRRDLTDCRSCIERDGTPNCLASIGRECDCVCHSFEEPAAPDLRDRLDSAEKRIALANLRRCEKIEGGCGCPETERKKAPPAPPGKGDADGA